MVGLRRAGLRPGVAPRPDQPLARPGKALEQPRDRVGVAVVPAADGVDGALDVGVVLAHGALLPVLVAALVPEPLVDERRPLLHPLEPHVAPPVTDDRRIRRAGVPAEHRRRPHQHVLVHAATVVVHVVGVAVVRRAEGDDRLQRRRPPSRHLQPVEPAPRDAHHADLAAAPRLLGEPRDHLAAVELLLGQVLVLEDAVGLPGAALIHAHHRVAVTGDVGKLARVAHGGAVIQAVGQILDDGRHRIGVGVLGQPDTGGEPAAVCQRDPHRLESPHGARIVGHQTHPHPRYRISAAPRGSYHLEPRPRREV